MGSARHRARANLLEILKGLRIRNQESVGELAATQPLLAEKLQSMTAAAGVVRQDYRSDGSVAVTVSMNLFGGLAQLLLPREIVPVEAIKAAGAKPPLKPHKPPGDGPAPAPPPPYTGLIVDARGLEVQPALAPRIFSENGNAVYDYAFVSREFAVQQGVCSYLTTPAAEAATPRVGEHPLLVLGLRTGGSDRCDLIISNTDAARIRNAAEHLSFMRQCRVVFIVE